MAYGVSATRDIDLNYENHLDYRRTIIRVFTLCFGDESLYVSGERLWRIVL